MSYGISSNGLPYIKILSRMGHHAVTERRKTGSASGIVEVESPILIVGVCQEYGRAIVSDSVGLEEGRTTLGKVQKRKIFYRKNEDGSVTKYTLDTTDITNDIHKWLADRGYSKVG